MSATVRCPAGHDSAATDYCDVCGLAIGAAPAPPAPDAAEAAGAPGDAAADGTCPSCGAANPPNALFCEACGYDFTTGTMPRPLTPPADPAAAPTTAAPVVPPPPEGGPAPAGPAPASTAPPLSESWVAEVWIDPDWYADQKSTDPLPSPGLPVIVPLRTTSVLIGRASRSRGITPDIDLSSDNGISRRHAQLTTDGTRWFVEDLGSSNGTYVGSSVTGLPTSPVPPGQKHEVMPDERVYLGAWTRLVIRRATPDEI